MRKGRTTIALIGCGHVGMACAHAILRSNLIREIVLIDESVDRAKGKALALQQAVPLGMPVKITAGSYRDAAASEIAILTVGAPGKFSGSRLDMLSGNVSLAVTASQSSWIGRAWDQCTANRRDISMAAIASLTKLAAWKALEAHYPKIRELHLRKLFADDPKRGERMTAEAVGIYFDFSKHRITDETLALSLQLAEESGLRARIDAMFRGDKINVTEKRAVLHVALRTPKGQSISVEGKDVVPQVHAVLDKMADFSTRVRDGEWKGYTGKPIRNVINIGIGGSDLGPVMAYEALRHYSRRDLTFRFVSNIDGTDFFEATRDLNAEDTLFIVSSKTFSTLETMTNARTARDWTLAA